MDTLFVTEALNWLEIAATEKVGWFYLAFFLSALVENLFPPYPGDLVTFSGGYLAGIGKLHLEGVFISTCLGSLSGAMFLYWIGKKGGRKVFAQDKGFMLNKSNLNKIENWFVRYGEKVIILSRFLAGVRSGVSLTAGIANVNLRKMMVYSAVSILVWNGIILFVAGVLKKNTQDFYNYFRIYNWVVLGIVSLFFAVWLIRVLRLKKLFKKGLL